MERRNQLWAEIASHQARSEVGEEAAMLARVRTFAGHYVRELYQDPLGRRDI
jgi:hypothetical protein